MINMILQCPLIKKEGAVFILQVRSSYENSPTFSNMILYFSYLYTPTVCLAFCYMYFLRYMKRKEEFVISIG